MGSFLKTFQHYILIPLGAYVHWGLRGAIGSLADQMKKDFYNRNLITGLFFFASTLLGIIIGIIKTFFK